VELPCDLRDVHGRQAAATAATAAGARAQVFGDNWNAADERARAVVAADPTAAVSSCHSVTVSFAFVVCVFECVCVCAHVCVRVRVCTRSW
jgi:hypothetical protein